MLAGRPVSTPVIDKDVAVAETITTPATPASSAPGYGPKVVELLTVGARAGDGAGVGAWVGAGVGVGVAGAGVGNGVGAGTGAGVEGGPPAHDGSW